MHLLLNQEEQPEPCREQIRYRSKFHHKLPDGSTVDACFKVSFTRLSQSKQMRPKVENRVEEADDPLPEANGVILAAPLAFAVAGRIRRLARCVGIVSRQHKKAGQGSLELCPAHFYSDVLEPSMKLD